MNEKITSRPPRANAPSADKDPGPVIPPGAKYLTKSQMAALLQVSVRCITDMMKRGDLPYVKINSSLVRFSFEAVQQRLKERALAGKAVPTAADSSKDAQ